jgi:hypothetical protein
MSASIQIGFGCRYSMTGQMAGANGGDAGTVPVGGSPSRIRGNVSFFFLVSLCVTCSRIFSRFARVQRGHVPLGLLLDCGVGRTDPNRLPGPQRKLPRNHSQSPSGYPARARSVNTGEVRGRE